MKRRTFVATTLACALFALPALGQQPPVKIAGLVELSGTGTTSGTNFNNGVKLAVKEINAAGGILGTQDRVHLERHAIAAADCQGARRSKAIDDGAYVVMGPVFSGSILVSMAETKRAEIPNFTGGEAASITQQGNPYVFRTSFTQIAAMPKVARYLKDNVKAKTVAMIWVNNDFGKGGRDVFVKAIEAQGIKLAADISTDPGQLDFSGAVLKAKQANADALFVYSNEEESARALRELRKQGYDKPIVGETVLTSQKVIELAGEAANGAVAHVGLTADAPSPAIKAYAEKFQKEYRYKSDHNGLKGYTAMYIVKAVTEKLGKFDSKAFAAAMHGVKLSAKDYPGVLMDVSFDKNGDLDRESFMTKVVNGKQEVIAVLPAARRTSSGTMASPHTFGIAGLLGWPVAHSRSPVIHNHWLAHYGIPGRYVLFAVPPDNLEAALRGLPVLGLRGCNVTTPHKQAVMPLIDHVDEMARRVGAVNTIVAEADGSLRGFNNDGNGFVQSVRDVRPDWRPDARAGDGDRRRWCRTRGGGEPCRAGRARHPGRQSNARACAADGSRLRSAHHGRAMGSAARRARRRRVARELHQPGHGGQARARARRSTAWHPVRSSAISSTRRR